MRGLFPKTECPSYNLLDVYVSTQDFSDEVAESTKAALSVTRSRTLTSDDKKDGKLGIATYADVAFDEVDEAEEARDVVVWRIEDMALQVRVQNAATRFQCLSDRNVLCLSLS